LPLFFRRHRITRTPEGLLRAQRPTRTLNPPPASPATAAAGPATQSWTPGSAVCMKSISHSAAAAHPMAVSVAPDAATTSASISSSIGSSAAASPESRCCCLVAPDQCGGTAGALDGVLVGQKAHVRAMTLADHDDATGDRTGSPRPPAGLCGDADPLE
jgi:hypothetical protein